eukprot:2535649-Pleurochrysis_carterae.AAC.2
MSRDVRTSGRSKQDRPGAISGRRWRRANANVGRDGEKIEHGKLDYGRSKQKNKYEVASAYPPGRRRQRYSGQISELQRD